MAANGLRKLTYLSFLLVSVFSSLSFAYADEAALAYSFTPPAGWIRDPEFTRAREAWSSPGDDGTLTLQTARGTENFALDTEDLPNLVALLTKIRSTASEFLGVEEWKIENYEFERKDKGGLLKLRGSYRGVGGRRVAFEEHQYFVGRFFFSLTFSESEIKRMSPQSRAEILSRFSPDGWSSEPTKSKTGFRFWPSSLWPKEARASDSQGQPCAHCDLPRESPPAVDLRKYIPSVSHSGKAILSPEELSRLSAAAPIDDCSLRGKGTPEKKFEASRCATEIWNGVKAGFKDGSLGVLDVAKMGIKGVAYESKSVLQLARVWWKTGNAAEAFQEYKRNHVALFKKLLENVRKLGPAIRLLAKEGMTNWQCMNAAERELLVCKASAYAVTQGALALATLGSATIVLNLAKAGKLGAAAVKLSSAIEKAKGAVELSVTALRIRRAAVLSRVSLGVSESLNKVRWIQKIFVTGKGKVYFRKGAEIFEVTDQKLKKVAVSRWAEFHTTPGSLRSGATAVEAVTTEVVSAEVAEAAESVTENLGQNLVQSAWNLRNEAAAGARAAGSP